MAIINLNNPNYNFLINAGNLYSSGCAIRHTILMEQNWKALYVLSETDGVPQSGCRCTVLINVEHILIQNVI